MKLPQEIEALIKGLPEESQVVVGAISTIYESKFESQEKCIKVLEDQIAKNSENSSKPPSSDGLNKLSPKSLGNWKLINYPNFAKLFLFHTRRKTQT